MIVAGTSHCMRRGLTAYCRPTIATASTATAQAATPRATRMPPVTTRMAARVIRDSNERRNTKPDTSALLLGSLPGDPVASRNASSGASMVGPTMANPRAIRGSGDLETLQAFRKAFLDRAANGPSEGGGRPGGTLRPRASSDAGEVNDGIFRVAEVPAVGLGRVGGLARSGRRLARPGHRPGPWIGSGGRRRDRRPGLASLDAGRAGVLPVGAIGGGRADARRAGVPGPARPAAAARPRRRPVGERRLVRRPGVHRRRPRALAGRLPPDLARRPWGRRAEQRAGGRARR